MSAFTSDSVAWRRSSRCVSSGCVEVAVKDDQIVVRDSKVESGPVLRYTADEWVAFLDGVKAGEFDLSAFGS